jgi:CheY-like chemotaxis protein
MEKILVVDDEASIRDSTALMLGRLGFSVDTAENGAEARAMFEAKHYDVVLTDLRMPGMDGQELAKQLKSINPDLKVILVTALPPADATTLFETVILKPFSFRQLSSAMAEALHATHGACPQDRRLSAEGSRMATRVPQPNAEVI